MKRLIAIPAALVLFGLMLPTEVRAQSPESGSLTDVSLGNVLRTMGLKPNQEKLRYDFRFKAVLDGKEWELSMSSVLSTDKKTIWVMAWLDELPKSAADVPRTALLRLLADNDRLGKGMFFAYIASNRRFVLQRVVANQNVTADSFKNVLKELGKTVVVTYPHWSVSNWKNGNSAPSTATQTTAGQSGNPQRPRTTLRDPKFSPIRRN